MTLRRSENFFAKAMSKPQNQIDLRLNRLACISYRPDSRYRLRMPPATDPCARPHIHIIFPQGRGARRRHAAQGPGGGALFCLARHLGARRQPRLVVRDHCGGAAAGMRWRRGTLRSEHIEVIVADHPRGDVETIAGASPTPRALLDRVCQAFSRISITLFASSSESTAA